MAGPHLPGRHLLHTYLGHPFRVLLFFSKVLCAGHLCFSYLYSWGTVSGPSMLPGFEVWGEGVVVAHRHRRGRDVRVGDLVQFKVPVSEDDAIKRVAGLPGDYVLVHSPDRRQQQQQQGGRGEMIQVPKGHCWVLGDNLPASKDSRLYGPVPMALIDGKVIYKTGPWPFPWQWHRIINPFDGQPKSSD
ncbi:unnamed protein product [Discula destructiva]